MVGDVLNLLAAILAFGAACFAVPLLQLGPNSPFIAIGAALLAILSSVFWMGAAIWAIVERRRGP
jgi:hypothetical protein